MSDLDPRRRDDVIIAEISQSLKDHISRYERDYLDTQAWRKTTEVTLEMQRLILMEISPAYNRGKWIVGLVMIGSIGIAVKAFWQHIKWQ